VPLPFASKPRRVIAFKGDEQVWVSTPSSGLQKRQCSIVLTICANGMIFDIVFFINNCLGTSLTPAIIFRGKGTRSKNEIPKYAKGVVVMWQQKAWADREKCLDWVLHILKPHVNILFILFYFILIFLIFISSK
jgi:hypothetical protein